MLVLMGWVVARFYADGVYWDAVLLKTENVLSAVYDYSVVLFEAFFDLVTYGTFDEGQ